MQVRGPLYHQIKAGIAEARLRRQSGDEMKAMLGDSSLKPGVFARIVSGSSKDLPFEQLSEAWRNRLQGDPKAWNDAYIELTKFGLRLAEEHLDEQLRGFGVVDPEWTPRNLKAEFDYKRQVFRAREHYRLEQMEKNPNPLVKEWMQDLGLDLHRLSKPISNPTRCDREGGFLPTMFLALIADMGLLRFGMPTPHGFGFNQQETDGVLDFLPEIGGGPGGNISSHKSIGFNPIKKAGTPEQKQFLSPLIANGDEFGRFMCCFGLTERCSGTNAIEQMKTNARLSEDGRHWIINTDDGSGGPSGKIFHTNWWYSGLEHLALNILDDDGTKLPSLLLMPLPFRLNDTPEQKEEKRKKLWEQGLESPQRPMELNAIKTSTQGFYEMYNVKAPVELAPGVPSVLGGPSGIGRGSEFIFGGLNEGRLGFARFCAATIQFVFNLALDEIVERERFPRFYSNPEFGKSLANLPAVQRDISEVAINMEIAKAVSELTSALVDNHHDMNIIAEAAFLKAMASELAWDAAVTSTRLFGGMGLMKGQFIEQALRDTFVPLIVEGVNPAMLQHGAGVSAGPALAMSQSIAGKAKILLNQIPFPFECGDFTFKEALKFTLSAKGLSCSTMAKGAWYEAIGARMKRQQLTLIDIAWKEITLYCQMAATLKLKDPNLSPKTRAALEQYLQNSESGKDKYPTWIGKLYIRDAFNKAQETHKKDKELLRKYS